MVRKVWAALRAAVTSPEAVKQEKSLAVFVAIRVLQSLGAYEGIYQILHSLGVV